MNDTVSSCVAPRVLVLGLGESGVAAALWAARQGAWLRVADDRAAPPGLEALREALAATGAQVEFRLGTFEPSLVEAIDQVVISPGLAPDQAPAAVVVAAAREAGIEVIGEIELFARALAWLQREREYAPRVLAVTGTNGKTTVTALTAELVRAGGLSAEAAGNIGPAALTALMRAMDASALPSVWVLELSSFQLAMADSLQPDVGVVLNVTQDHLDWHGDLDAYARAKAKLLSAAQIAIVNRDDPLTLAMVSALSDVRVRSFGRDLPELVGDTGLEDSHGVQWLTACEATDFEDAAPAPTGRRRKGAAAPVRSNGRLSRLMPADALRIRGVHNATNVLVALMLARSLGLGLAPLLHAAREYAGERHRTEFVRSIGGIDYVNDSKGTNVGATVAALEGLGGRLVLIAGGVGKGQDFSPLAPAVARHARAVVLIGEDGPAIGQALAQTGVPCATAATLEQAVARAHELAEPGDIVLLSPACASFDMFRNYPHRGEQFERVVQALALDHGEVE